MKAIIACFLITLSYSTQAWVFPKAAFQKAASIVSVATLLSTSPLVSNAVDFTGSYSDPKHPNCQRVITVKGSDALLKGTDGNPGCPPDGSGKEWKLIGSVDGSNILVDFTPKGGPPGLKGVWDGDGIKWPDGNKWSLKGN